MRLIQNDTPCEVEFYFSCKGADSVRCTVFCDKQGCGIVQFVLDIVVMQHLTGLRTVYAVEFKFREIWGKLNSFKWFGEGCGGPSGF